MSIKDDNNQKEILFKNVSFMELRIYLFYKVKYENFFVFIEEKNKYNILVQENDIKKLK